MITVRLHGGMGNQMFQYAVGRALAIKNNTKLELDIEYLEDRSWRPKFLQKKFVFREYDLIIFNIKVDGIRKKSKIHFLRKYFIAIDLFYRRIFKPRGTEKSFGFDPNILYLSGNIYLDGKFQSYKYFENIQDVIKKDFTLKNSLPENIEKLKQEILNINSLCVHVRRGDFVGNKLHEVVDNDYYNNAIRQIERREKIDKIYVFSDDIIWCKENLKFNHNTQFVEDEFRGEKSIGHFSLMVACKHFIIPNSTFSWWAAWLSDSPQKVVIAPKNWFKDTSMDYSDIYPPDWIRM